MVLILVMVLTVFILGILTLFIAKEISSKFKKTTSLASVSLKTKLLIFLTLLLIPGLMAVLLISSIYRQLVSLIFKIKYGSRFSGLLEGCDNMFALNATPKSPTLVLNIIRYDHSRKRKFYDTISEIIHYKIETDFAKSPKTLASFNRAFGYGFLLKNGVKPEDCFKKLRQVDTQSKEIEKSDLINIIEEYCDTQLPNEGLGLWDVCIGTQPINWNQNLSSDAELYPVLFRCHHSLTDFTDFINTIFATFTQRNKSETEQDYKSYDCIMLEPINKYFGKSNSPYRQIVFEEIDPKTEVLLIKSVFSKLNKLMLYWKTFSLFCLCASFFLDLGVYIKNPLNSICGCRLTNRRVLSLYAEEEPRYLDAIQDIRRRIPGTTFTNVILTCISASITDYFQKISGHHPEYIIVGLMSSPRAGKQEDSACNTTNKVYCSNALYVAPLKVPLPAKENTSLITRLRLIQQEESNRFSHPEVVKVGYKLLKMFYGQLPYPLLEFILNYLQVTTVVSNTQRVKYVVFHSGLQLEDFLCVPSLAHAIGLTFIITTYRGRLNISMAVDKALVCKKDEVECVLNNIYRYIDILKSETENNLK